MACAGSRAVLSSTAAREWKARRALAVPDADDRVADVVTARGAIESGDDPAHRPTGPRRTATTGHQLPGPGKGQGDVPGFDRDGVKLAQFHPSLGFLPRCQKRGGQRMQRG